MLSPFWNKIPPDAGITCLSHLFETESSSSCRMKVPQKLLCQNLCDNVLCHCRSESTGLLCALHPQFLVSVWLSSFFLFHTRLTLWQQVWAIYIPLMSLARHRAVAMKWVRNIKEIRAFSNKGMDPSLRASQWVSPCVSSTYMLISSNCNSFDWWMET